MWREIRDMGRVIEERWRASGYREEAFAEIATDVLKRHAPHQSLSTERLIASACGAVDLDRQLDPNACFGAPPLTVHHGGRFVIDVYFWTSPRTTIHDHSFSGAFSTLSGKSLHNRYGFAVDENFDDSVLVGELRRTDTELLSPGQVRPIEQGMVQIHQVAHLTHPTVSIVVRTLASCAVHGYLQPGIAAVQNEDLIGEVARRKIQFISLLHKTQHPKCDELVRDMVRSSSQLGAFWILFEFYNTVQDSHRLESLLDSLGPQRPRWGSALLRGIEHQAKMPAEWKSVTEEGERLLLALTASVSEQHVAEEIIRSYSPGAPVGDAILEWVRGLVQHRVVDFELNKTAEIVLHTLFSGGSEAQACDSLQAHFGIGDRSRVERDVREFCDLIRDVPMLASLTRRP